MFYRDNFECICINDFYVIIRGERVKLCSSGDELTGYISKTSGGVPCFKVFCAEYAIALYDEQFNYYFRIEED